MPPAACISEQRSPRSVRVSCSLQFSVLRSQSRQCLYFYLCWFPTPNSGVFVSVWAAAVAVVSEYLWVRKTLGRLPPRPKGKLPTLPALGCCCCSESEKQPQKCTKNIPKKRRVRQQQQRIGESGRGESEEPPTYGRYCTNTLTNLGSRNSRDECALIYGLRGTSSLSASLPVCLFLLLDIVPSSILQPNWI